jgi:hypothetical protein
MDARGPQEARLLAVERGLEAMDRDIRALRRQTIALSQGIWDAWNEVGLIVVEPPMHTCTASYATNVFDACGNAIGGATITIKDHASGATLGTATSSSMGVVSGSVTISSPSENVDVIASKSGYSNVTLATVFSCGANTVANITMGAGVASVSVCGGWCAAASQTLVDSIYGGVTLTWNGTAWIGTHSGLHYPGGVGGCGSATISIIYKLDTSGNINVAWQVNGSNCPVASGTAFNQTFTGNANCSFAPPHIAATNSGGPTTSAPYRLRLGVTAQTFTVTLA